MDTHLRQSTLEEHWSQPDSEANSQPGLEVDLQLEDDSENTRLKYKNLYWSRLVSLQQYQPGEHNRWPMAPDVEEEQEAFKLIEEEEVPEHHFTFDPQAFCDENSNLKIVDF